MKCNTRNIPVTKEWAKRRQKENIKNNNQYLNYASRCLMMSVRQNAGYGVSRLAIFNSGAHELGKEYIERYSPPGYEMSDRDYAVDSYYAMRRDLLYAGWDPEVELWGYNPFTDADLPAPAGHLTVRERRIREDYLYYANAISFYVREMYCMAALELHNNGGFGAMRLSRVLHPCRDRWLELMRVYLAIDKPGVERLMRAVLEEFNGMGCFAKEVVL